MFRVLHSLLAISVTMVYVVGLQFTVEFEHSHHVHGDHGHSHVADSSEHDHHHHHDPAPSDDESRDTPHRHSHSVTVGMDMPSAPAVHLEMGLDSWTRHDYFQRGSEPCPDGPCFDLIKPPQLG